MKETVLRSIKELRDLLSGIPNELGELYAKTPRRPNHTQSRAPAKSKYERYMMFEIVKCCREPFSMYQLLGATLFLTTGKGTYPDDQMDIFLSPEVLNSMRDRPQAQLPVTYTGPCLHKSFAESLRIHNGDITQGDRIHQYIPT